MLSESSLAAASSAAAAGSSESSEASHWAAIASWSRSLPLAMIMRPAESLDQDFLEQHRTHLLRRQRDIDALGQLLLEAKQTGRAVDVAGAQFAQIGLEQIGDARQRRLDRLELLLFLDLEHDLDLEVLHALAGGADQIDHHVRHFDKGRRLRRRRLGVLLLAVAAHQEEPARAGAKDGDEPDCGNDQLELALFCRGDFRAFGRAALCLVVRHCPARSNWERTRLPPAGP